MPPKTVKSKTNSTNNTTKSSTTKATKSSTTKATKSSTTKATKGSIKSQNPKTTKSTTKSKVKKIASNTKKNKNPKKIGGTVDNTILTDIQTNFNPFIKYGAEYEKRNFTSIAEKYLEEKTDDYFLNDIHYIAADTIFHFYGLEEFRGPKLILENPTLYTKFAKLTHFETEYLARDNDFKFHNKITVENVLKLFERAEELMNKRVETININKKKAEEEAKSRDSNEKNRVIAMRNLQKEKGLMF